jgi:hypothetical protein
VITPGGAQKAMARMKDEKNSDMRFEVTDRGIPRSVRLLLIPFPSLRGERSPTTPAPPAPNHRGGVRPGAGEQSRSLYEDCFGLSPSQ